eukprot:1379656-Rhodomonas_salina.1
MAAWEGKEGVGGWEVREQLGVKRGERGEEEKRERKREQGARRHEERGEREEEYMRSVDEMKRMPLANKDEGWIWTQRTPC